MNAQTKTAAATPAPAAAPEGYYEAELKIDLPAADVGGHESPSGVSHRWGYAPGGVWMRRGARCYVTYQPEYTAGGTNGTYTIPPRWWVYFTDRKVLVMTTDAAKKFLKARRVSGRAVRNDAAGKALAENYQYEMSR